MGWARVLPVLAAITCAAVQAGPVEPVGQWSLRQEGAIAAWTPADTGEQLGLLCPPDRDDCVFYLKPGWACEVGKPLLVRLEGEQGILRLGPVCTDTALGPVAVFAEDLAAFVRGSPAIEVSLVSPARERLVLRFANAGAAAALVRAQEARAGRPGPAP